MTEKRTLLGFDYGKKRIGSAIGQEFTGTASALVTINNKATKNHTCSKAAWAEIEALIKQWQPALIIVGLPINMDDTQHELHDTVKDFGHSLQQRYNIPVEWIDERLSSIEAENALTENRQNPHQSGKKRQHNKSDIDKLAAEYILQSWLNQPR